MSGPARIVPVRSRTHNGQRALCEIDCSGLVVGNRYSAAVGDAILIGFAVIGLVVIGLGFSGMWRGDLDHNDPRPRFTGRFGGWHPGRRTPMAKGDIGDGGDRPSSRHDTEL
jgi:hypothetical protein